MTGMDTSTAVQLGVVSNPSIRPAGTGPAAPRDPDISYEDGYTHGAEGASGAESSSHPHSGVMQIVLAAKGKVVGLRVGLTSNPGTPEQTAETLQEVEAQVAEAEEAYETMEASDPEYDVVTQELIELHSNAVVIASFAASQLSAQNSPEDKAAIAASATRLILSANNFTKKVKTAYIDTETSQQIQALDLASSNAAYVLVNICRALGLEIDTDLAKLAETAPAGASDPTGQAEHFDTATWLSELQADLLIQAYRTLAEMNQKIRDAFRADSEEERILEEKQAEERAEELRLMKNKIEDKLEETVQAIQGVLNNPSLDPATAQKKLGALLDDVNDMISQLTTLNVEIPGAVSQNIMTQLDQVKSQLEQFLDSLPGQSQPVTVAQLGQQIGGAASQLATAMASLGMAVDPAVAELARA